MMAQTMKNLEDMSKRMRLKALDMAYSAGKNGAHLGGGLSAIEIFTVLYGDIANAAPEKTSSNERDYILVSKAHCVLAYYAALYEKGFLTDEEIGSFEKNGTKFVGHPVRNIEKGIEYSGGSLGMALSVACGIALAAKNKGSGRKVYVILGDGECQEGSVWEAFFFAAKYQLDNLTVIVDQNGIQSDGTVAEIGGFDDLASKIKAFGFHVIEADGHSVGELLDAFHADACGKPKAIVARTVKGKGVSFMENDYRWHHSSLSRKQYEQAVAEIEHTP